MPSVASATSRATVAATSTPHVPAADLHFGMRGPAVRELQRCLVRLGHLTQAQVNTGPGIFGPKTRAAVAEFQRKHGVPGTGAFGPKTRAAMRQALATHAPAPAAPATGPSVHVDGVGRLSWDKAVKLVKQSGAPVCPGGRPTVLAVRTGRGATASYRDSFVVLKPGGKMTVFKATTRPTRGGSGTGMLEDGAYDIVPRWRDGKFHNDAFIVRNKNHGMSVDVVRDLNRDGFFSAAEQRQAGSSTLIRIHRGNASTTSSLGCLNVQNYDAFLRSIGGRDAHFNMAVVEA